MLALARNDADGALKLQVELRRDAQALASQHGSCRLRWRCGDGAWSGAPWNPEPLSVVTCEQALRAERVRLDWVHGELELALTLDSQEIVLREPFSWDGRAVKDWMVLGPQAVGREPEPASKAEDVRLDQVFQDPQGRPLAWTAHAFNPSRVARAMRHFYDLGDVFQCPEGVCSAWALVEAEQEGGVEIEFYHDGNARLWLNGVELDLSRGHRQSVTLESGKNLVWVRLSKVAQQGRGLYLAMHSTDGGARGLRFCLPDGVPLPARKA